jgi:penicillin-insensitive murein endopeptidase
MGANPKTEGQTLRETPMSHLLTFEAAPFRAAQQNAEDETFAEFAAASETGTEAGFWHEAAESEWEVGSWAARYPADVRKAIGMGGAMWPLALSRAIARGYRDTGTLANIAFFMHHPERNGRPIATNEPGASGLIELWKFFRDAAKNMISPAPSSSPAGSCGRTVPQVDTLMPASAPGLEANKPASHRYGLPETIAALKEIGRRWLAAHPAGLPVRIRDISHCGGGKFSPHGSHRMGIDVDIGLMRNDGSKEGVNFKLNPGKYSRALTQEMVNTIRNNGLLKVHRIYFADRQVSNVTYDNIHNDHVHVRFCLPARYNLQAMKRAAFPEGTKGTYAACAPEGKVQLGELYEKSPPARRSATPALLRRVNEPFGATLYVKISLGAASAAKPVTGIFIPQSYVARPQVDVILYLHGHKAAGVCGPGDSAAIDGYWRSRYWPLREEIARSGKNAILIAPTLGPKSQPGNLTDPGGFETYVDQVLAVLSAYGPFPRAGRSLTVGNIILACHSGGGSPMRRLALGSDRYVDRVRECWGFDSLYNRVDPELWARWAKSRPDARLFIHHLGSTQALSKRLLDKQLPNVCVERSTARSHCWVPIEHWRHRIQTSASLQAVGRI